MLVARQLLELIEDMVSNLASQGTAAVPEASVQGQYIAIVCMLRSVGHVLEKTDCAVPEEKQFLKSKWLEWKKEHIFTSFIEPDRNRLLKEFASRLQLRGNPDISHIVYADPRARNFATVAMNFDPDTLCDLHGRKVMPLFRSAIAFWQAHLEEIEAFRNREARNNDPACHHHGRPRSGRDHGG